MNDPPNESYALKPLHSKHTPLLLILLLILFQHFRHRHSWPVQHIAHVVALICTRHLPDWPRVRLKMLISLPVPRQPPMSSRAMCECWFSSLVMRHRWSACSRVPISDAKLRSRGNKRFASQWTGCRETQRVKDSS